MSFINLGRRAINLDLVQTVDRLDAGGAGGEVEVRVTFTGGGNHTLKGDDASRVWDYVCGVTPWQTVCIDRNGVITERRGQS